MIQPVISSFRRPKRIGQCSGEVIASLSTIPNTTIKGKRTALVAAKEILLRKWWSNGSL